MLIKELRIPLVKLLSSGLHARKVIRLLPVFAVAEMSVPSVNRISHVER